MYAARVRAAAELVHLYEAVVAELSAERLVARACAADPPPGGRVVALGLGKVAVEMLAGARSALGARLAEGLVVAPVDAPAPRFGVALRGAHPIPDVSSIAAGEALLAAARRLGPEDSALLLISGGGSALAEAPAAGIAVDDLRALNRELLGCGAPVEEVNAVRAHLSRLKGGGLARALLAGGVRRARALVLVDVPSGAPAAVASGPAAIDISTYIDAVRIAARRHLRLTAAVRGLLEEGARGQIPETLKPGEPAADLVAHVALCDLSAPALVAERLAAGLRPRREPGVVRGPVEEVAKRYAASEAALLVASGEPDVVVPRGAPPGGRCQHLALLVARAIRGRPCAFLAAGTDGRDGETGAAGAVVDGATWDRAPDPERALATGAAAPCLAAAGATLPARHTGAHAGDLHLFLRG